MPLPLTVSCFSKIQIAFTFLVSAHQDSPGKRAFKRVCVCVFIVSDSSLGRSVWHVLTRNHTALDSCHQHVYLASSDSGLLAFFFLGLLTFTVYN